MTGTIGGYDLIFLVPVECSPKQLSQQRRTVLAAGPGAPVEFAQDILRKANGRWFGHLPAPPATMQRHQCGSYDITGISSGDRQRDTHEMFLGRARDSLSQKRSGSRRSHERTSDSPDGAEADGSPEQAAQ